MLTINNIKNVTIDTDFDFYGIRTDEGIVYKVGDIANNSHELYQDPVFNDEGELVYPYVEDGIYAGLYDAGELDGTCCIAFNPDSDDSITEAITLMRNYYGNHLHIIAGNYACGGNDIGELFIREAKVLGAFIKNKEE